MTRLRGEEFKSDLQRTEGISIHTEKSQVYKDECERRALFTLNIWDFSGRNEFTATHHLFTKSESTTLIVMDITKDLHAPLDENPKLDYPNTPAEVLHYWISALLVEASENNTDPNFALVLTHKDKIPSDNPQEYIDAYLQQVLEVVKDYTNCITKKNIHVVDNKTGLKSEFQCLRNQLLEHFSKQGGWGKKIPVPWLKLKAQIMQKSEEGKNYLDSEEVKELALQHGIESQNVKTFLQTEDAVGNMKYFPNLNIVITNLKWLVNKCKALITKYGFQGNRKTIKEDRDKKLKQGLVNEYNLAKLWGPDEVPFVRKLMKDLDILVEESNGIYLFPNLLPSPHTQVDQVKSFPVMVQIYDALHRPTLGDRFLIGTFHMLLSRCSKQYNWRLNIEMEEQDLSYTNVSFYLKEGIQLALTLTSPNEMRARIWSSKEMFGENVSAILTFCKETREKIAKVMKICRIKPDETFQMHCPHFDTRQKDACLIGMQEYVHPTPRIVSYEYDTAVTKCPIHGKWLRYEPMSLLAQATGNSISAIHSFMN